MSEAPTPPIRGDWLIKPWRDTNGALFWALQDMSTGAVVDFALVCAMGLHRAAEMLCAEHDASLEALT